MPIVNIEGHAVYFNTMAEAELAQHSTSIKNAGINKSTMKKAAPAEKGDKPLVPPEGFTFGADPELFVQDPEGRIVCADMIPGTKDEPYKVEHGAIQRDGFAAEYNIDVCKTFEEWNRNHKAVQGQLQSMLPKDYKLVATTSVRFSPEVFEAAPDCAKELGCSPDWNAWTGQLNPPPRLPDDPYMRCIGGHIHFGWGEDMDTTDIQHRMNCFDLVKQLDYFLGAWSLKHDRDRERRSLYGKAGACRIKSYGVEYRTLSSFWVLDKARRLDVWNRAVKALEAMSKYELADNMSRGINDLVQSSINSGRLDRTLEAHANFPLQTLSLPAVGL